MFDFGINMSITDYLWSYIRRLSSYFYQFNSLRRTFKNYVEVAIKLKKHNFPITVKYRDGNIQVFNNLLELNIAARGFRDCFSYSNNIFSVNYKKLNAKFYDAIENGDIGGVFFGESWKMLPVKNLIVVDVGTNIGDSAVYFALQGASKVIAIEPFPKNFELARKNIILNNLEDKIELLLIGCSNEKKEIILSDDSFGASASIYSENSTSGKKIKLVTLEEIINKYQINSAVIKLDCEGCEYDIILTSSCDTIRKFDYIMLEYHNGYKNIKKKLESCGYEVSIIGKPLYHNNPNGIPKKLYVGALFAQKNQNRLN